MEGLARIPEISGDEPASVWRGPENHSGDPSSFGYGHDARVLYTMIPDAASRAALEKIDTWITKQT
jgi:hypothetical protein